MAPREKSEIIADISELISTPGYTGVLLDIIARDAFSPMGHCRESDWRERISYQETAYLLGLLLKKNAFSWEQIPNDEKDILAQKTKDLLHEMQISHFNHMDDATDRTPTNQNTPPNELFTSGDGIIEPTFYSDSGAHDFQFIRLAPKLYEHDKTWLLNKKIDLDKFGAIYEAIKRMSQFVQTLRFNPKILIKNGALAKEVWLAHENLQTEEGFLYSTESILESVNNVDSGITEEDVIMFLDLFSVEARSGQNQSLKMPGDYNVLTAKPIIRILVGEKEFFLFSLFFDLASVIYKSPAYWMLRDKAYKDEFARNRGNSIEQITYDNLITVFPNNRVWRGVKIMRGNKLVTDIDVLVVCGSEAIVAQNKGKHMTAAALAGSNKDAQNDFAKSIQSAYDQGATSCDALQHRDEYAFYDSSGSRITFKQRISETYILCILSDAYPALTNQTRTQLRRGPDNPWPIPTTVFDLELLATYLDKPALFMKYLRERINTFDNLVAENELCYLGLFMEKGTLMASDKTLMFIDGDFAQHIGHDFHNHKGFGLKRLIYYPSKINKHKSKKRLKAKKEKKKKKARRLSQKQSRIKR